MALKFKKYNAKKEDDGFTIEKVPIFEAGTHRGRELDEKWWDKAIDIFNKEDKDKGFNPPTIIGHNDMMAEEKPAQGILKNLVREGKNIYADIARVGEDLYEDLKKNKWPYRSVELNPKKNRLSALALLGGTEPHFKLPNMEIQFCAKEDNDWVFFDENVVEDKVKENKLWEAWYAIQDLVYDALWDEDLEMEAKQTKLVEILQDAFEFMPKATEVDPGSGDGTQMGADGKPLKMVADDDNVDEEFAAKFAAKFGMSIKEFNEKMAADNKVKIAAQISAIIAKFETDKTHSFAKTVLDKFSKLREAVALESNTVQFNEKDGPISVGDALDDLMRVVFDLGKTGDLMTNFRETFEEGTEDPDSDEEKALKEEWDENKEDFEAQGISQEEHVKTNLEK